MKYRITKSVFDKLSDELKAEYEAADDGKGYTVIVEGAPEPEDSGELKRALDRVRDDLKEVTAERDEAVSKVGKGDTDVTKLTNRYEKKLADQKTAFDATLDGFKGQIGKLLKTNIAAPLASKISTAPKLLQPKIEERMTIEFPDDGSDAKVVFMGADGKPSPTLTADKLSEEFVANPDFASIIVGSKARGSSAPSSHVKQPLGSAQSDGKTDLMSQDRASFTDTIRAKIEAQRETPRA